ncbi:hypothetical protein KC332_g14 [Hortaea werneckii]|nr:hypothetical protein KC348_g19 [Hortaea werneckii]KAI7421948.1 hypothetical protein KC332_g14 [Hortaea werneckii]
MTNASSIALHTIGTVVFHKEPECQACSYGIWADFQGPDRVPGGVLTWDEYNKLNLLGIPASGPYERPQREHVASLQDEARHDLRQHRRRMGRPIFARGGLQSRRQVDAESVRDSESLRPAIPDKHTSLNSPCYQGRRWCEPALHSGRTQTVCRMTEQYVVQEQANDLLPICEQLKVKGISLRSRRRIASPIGQL